MNKKRFLETIKEMDTSKGVGSEVLLDALKESFRITFAKKIEDEYKIDKRVNVKATQNKDKVINKLPDALIRVDIDLNKAKINCYRQWLVVNDDDINDDYIEIGLEEAKEKNPKLATGDYYEEELSLDDLREKDISRFKSCFTQKINKAEKDALLSTFANKIGTIVTGSVEKCDANSVIVELGRTTATLFKKDLIGDEKFNQGDSIKVYVEGIGKDDKKGSLVKISRSCNGYLRKLFENEIHEIYDGTVVIKYVERIPGRRAKVCVYSNDPNVDPSGACIGQNGNRIQSIVSQLGNAKDNKEKIDVVTWNPNLGLFVSELLRPGKVLGMNIDEEKKEITVVTDDDSLNLAIGFKGTNVVLAKKITGYEIKVLDESQASEENIEYKLLEDYEIEAKEEERRRFREKQQEAIRSRAESQEAENEESATSENEEFVSEEVEKVNETVASSSEEPETEIQKTEEKVENNELIEENEPVIETKKVKEEEPIEFKEVKTTTTLESLEKSLEEEKKEKSSSKKSFKKKKKEFKKSDDDEEKEEKKIVQKMDIYTDEELEAFENEDSDEDYDDEEDYSEYDDDDYYEDR